MNALHFLVIGAAKSGTTTLFELLRQHPQLYLPPGKEDPFFSRASSFENGWDAYVRRSFAGAPAGALCGTVTPEYMAGTVYEHGGDPPRQADASTVLPERIHARFPDIKLIAILRDPVERCISQHAMFRRLGFDPRGVNDAIAELLDPVVLERTRLDQAVADTYVVWGEYGRILGGYYDMFAPSQLMVVFLDELASDPAGVMCSLYSHLGVDPDFVPAGLGRRYQPAIARSPYPRLDPFRLRLAAARVRPLRAVWDRLPVARRERVDRVFGELAYRTRLWTRTRTLSGDGASSTTRDALRAHYALDGERLAALIDREPPWLTRGPGTTRPAPDRAPDAAEGARTAEAANV
jgi:Sulfotransferase family